MNVGEDSDEDAITVATSSRRRRWTVKEMQQLSAAFGSCIHSKTMPSGKQISDLAKNMPGRTVAQIRTQINNLVLGKRSIVALNL